MKYTKALITACAVLLMFLFVIVNYNVNMTTSYVVFQNTPEDIRQSLWAPDRLLIIGVLIFVALVTLIYVIFKEKDML